MKIRAGRIQEKAGNRITGPSEISGDLESDVVEHAMGFEEWVIVESESRFEFLANLLFLLVGIRREAILQVVPFLYLGPRQNLWVETGK